ncbi:MAG: peptidase S41, partial [Candidatus Omnitrophica bacterium]|nr:peptidase S41 [Candidatus Omnitrophota bacterium]
GEAGTQVIVRLFREKEFEVSLKRELIEIDAIRDIRKVGRAIGYMQIMDFQEKTVQQMDKGLQDLEKQGVKALILDLRNDAGGLMTQAVAMAERFLPAGAKIVSVSSKIDVQSKEHVATGSVRVYDYPVVILVNQFSASASEIFSAAMQDNKRATIVGVKTFGKASVQSVIPLDESSAMKITTARYVSPKGRHIDGVGLVPDVVVEDGAPDNPAAQNQIKAAIAILKDFY